MIEFIFKRGRFRLDMGDIEPMNDEAERLAPIITRRWDDYCNDEVPCTHLEIAFFEEKLSRIEGSRLIRFEQSHAWGEF
ncbi:MAG: hypothetical protein BWK76_23100 [Desulfobulbaceae bacterium A2]|nr:MAG: hypothetical protein BWK76_23100 [Desulfobulbaceae bacterium A2]